MVKLLSFWLDIQWNGQSIFFYFKFMGPNIFKSGQCAPKKWERHLSSNSKPNIFLHKSRFLELLRSDINWWSRMLCQHLDFLLGGFGEQIIYILYSKAQDIGRRVIQKACWIQLSYMCMESGAFCNDLSSLIMILKILNAWLAMKFVHFLHYPELAWSYTLELKNSIGYIHFHLLTDHNDEVLTIEFRLSREILLSSLNVLTVDNLRFRR